MATDFFLTDVPSDVVATGLELIAQLGVRGDAGVTVSTTNTTGSGSLIQCTDTAGGTVVVWYSPPLAAVTISGTMTFNVWMGENNMSANVGPYVEVARCDETGAFISTIGGSGSGVELGTSRAAQNWTLAPTSTGLSDRDRLRIIVRGTNVGTMGAGFTFDLGYDGPSASADGDSYVRFTETLTAAPPIAKAASDTVAAGLTEASNYVIPILTDDPQAMTLGEGTSSVAVTVSRTDTLAATIAEAQQSFLVVGTADTLAAMLGEASALVNIVTAVNGLALGITDSSVLVITTPVVATDSLAAALAEVSAVTAQLSTADALAMTVAGVSAIAGTLVSTETLALTATQVAATAVTVATTDTAAVAAADTSALQISLAVSDAVIAGVTEASAIQAVLTRTDALAVTVTEGTSAVFVTLTRPDTLALTMGNIAALQVQQAVFDGLVLGTSEAVGIAGTIASADSLGAGGVETSALAVSIARIDTLAIGAIDSSGTLAQLTAADEMPLAADETYLLLVTVDRVFDTLVLTGTEDRALGGDFQAAQFLSSADVLALLEAETVVVVWHGIRGRTISADLDEMEGAFIGVPYTVLEEEP